MVPPNDQESGLSVRAQRRDAPLAPVSISNETTARSPRADNDAEAKVLLPEYRRRGEGDLPAEKPVPTRLVAKAERKITRVSRADILSPFQSGRSSSR